MKIKNMYNSSHPEQSRRINKFLLLALILFFQKNNCADLKTQNRYYTNKYYIGINNTKNPIFDSRAKCCSKSNTKYKSLMISVYCYEETQPDDKNLLILPFHLFFRLIKKPYNQYIKFVKSEETILYKLGDKNVSLTLDKTFTDELGNNLIQEYFIDFKKKRKECNCVIL